MKTGPPLDRIVSPLEAIGVHLDPSFITQILGWVPLLVASGLTFWGVIAKVNSDKKATVTDTLRQDNSDLRAEIASLREQKKAAEVEKVKAEGVADQARDEHRELLGVTRDQAQLIVAMAGDLLAAHAHITKGTPPPPPDLSWRVAEHLGKPGKGNSC